MRHEAAGGWAVAAWELGHSVHVEVNGLRPGRDYFYQFEVRGEESPVGHFRTAPERDGLVQRLQFAFATCQDWPSGYYIAYRDMLSHDLDLVLHLGDYTYEYGIDFTNRLEGLPEGFREETVDLRTYRLRHTLYKLDPDLQAVHRKFPFAVIWDDHEVANDYSGLAPEYGSPSPEFTARRAAAYQAFYEHMPIRFYPSRHPGELRIYRRLKYGRLAEFSLLDDRQYRTDNPCGDGESFRCDEALTGDYTMLGEQQEQWLARGLERSAAKWNIVGQQLLLAELEHRTIADEWYWNDAWDGYPNARRRLLADVVGSSGAV
jgi:alkaline phosphatase D